MTEIDRSLEDKSSAKMPSEIVWWNKTIPDPSVLPAPFEFEAYSGNLGLKNARAFPGSEKEIVRLPDRRAYRSMSRSAVILSAAALPVKDALESFLEEDPFSVGIYCAISHGPEDYACAKDLMGCDVEEFAQRYRKARSPKHYLKQLPNLAPAQLGIFLGIMGPVNTFNHSVEGCYHAVDQAEFDLRAKNVKAALICSAFSLEDPLLSMKTALEAPSGSVLAEGGVAVLLTQEADSALSRVLETGREQKNDTYCGIASPLMNLN